MWFHKKKTEVAPVMPSDTDTAIYYGYGENDFFPLEVDDPEEFRNSIEIIRSNLKIWMLQDQVFATTTNRSIESSLSYNLKEIDLKLLAYPSYHSRLLDILQDTEISHSGSRLMDVIHRIHLLIPARHIRVLQGRFLNGVLYGCGDYVGEIPLPSKKQWLPCIHDIPWIPFIAFIQEIYENDHDCAEIMKLIGSQTTPTVANDVTTITQNPNAPIMKS